MTTADRPGGGEPAPQPVAQLSYTEASRELDRIVEFFEQREVDVDQLVARLERATAIVDELDRRIRQTRSQVEELAPRLQAAARREGADDDDETSDHVAVADQDLEEESEVWDEADEDPGEEDSDDEDAEDDADEHGGAPAGQGPEPEQPLF